MKKQIALLLVLFSISGYAKVNLNEKVKNLKISALSGNIFGPTGLGTANKIRINVNFSDSVQVGSCTLSVGDTLVEGGTVIEGFNYGIISIADRKDGLHILAQNAYHVPEFTKIVCSGLTSESTVDDLQRELENSITIK